MKKIKDFFIPKNTSKYSDTFYKYIMLRSSIVVMLLSSVLLLFFVSQTISSQLQNAQKTLQTENEFCYSTFNDVLSSAKSTTLFFARFKDISPLYQSESKINVRKTILLQEAISFITTFDYINGICVETPEFVISHSIPSHVKYNKVMDLDAFTLYSTTADSFPHLLKLTYTASNLDTFNVDITMFSEYLSTHNMSANSYLLSSDGQILLAPDYNLIGKSIDDIVDIDFKDIQNKNASSKYLYTQQRFSDEGIILVSLMPKNEIYTSTLGQILSIFAIYLAVMTVAILCLSLVLDYIYRPIKNVAQVLKYYMPENDSLLESDAKFITMCMKRYTTTDEIDAALLRVRKGQLQTLHSQISPHLLGNILESIKWDLIEVVGEDTKMVKAISSLALFLAETYEYQRMITTIEAEIDRTKYYTDVMAYFYEQLQVTWEVSDEVLDCAIVSLSLQPFIENSVQHAFTHMEDDPHIFIRISSDNGLVFIEIEDNGMGIPPDALDSILSTLDDDASVQKHIGIKNSHLKLKLLFGDEYGVTDIQTGNEGTYVKITIPKLAGPILSPSDSRD